MPARLKEIYNKEVRKKLQDEFKIENVMAVPKIEKVVLNMGVGEAIQNAKILDNAVEELATITGQRPVITRAKKAIAAFKLREGVPIGTMVTLRGEKMYEFLDRLINVALPRVRDFRGVSPRCFDKHGNYTIGISDQSIFPEVELDKIKRNIGFDVTIVTTARTDEEAKSLLSEMGMPFSDRARKPTAEAA